MNVRIRTACLLILAILGCVAPGRAAATLPRLTRTTTFIARGPTATLVTLPKAVTVNPQNPSSWVQISHLTQPTGGYAGILLDNVNRRGSAWRPGLLYLLMAVPPCRNPMNGSCTPVETVATRLGARGYEKPWSTSFTLHPGTYRIYVFGHTNQISVRLTLPGLTGSSSIPVTKSAGGWLSHRVESSTVERIAAHPERAEPPSTSRIWSYTFPPGPMLLVAGQWRSQPTSEISPSTGVLSTCWRRIDRSGLPDYWWQDPHAVSKQATPACSNDFGADRAFAWSTIGGEHHINFSSSPLTAPNQYSGYFALPISLLDPQE